MSPGEAVVAIASFGLVAFFISTVAGLIRRKIDAGAPAALDAGVEPRLARIEQAVDAIAVEVERISEGQRFTTRLLAERAPGAALPPAKPGVPS